MKGAKPCYSAHTAIKNLWHRYDDWDVTVLEVVRDVAHAVIVIAGRTGVIQAGIAGWMLVRSTHHSNCWLRRRCRRKYGNMAAQIAVASISPH
jgi:hypothetical protein